MTTEDLKKALSQDTREKVDVNLGQVSLRPAVEAGGQYNVVTKATPKENSFTRLATALNQLPQIGGQIKNVRQQAAIREVQAMSRNEMKEELRKRAEGGDEEAKAFLFDFGKSEAVDQQLYRQLAKTDIVPNLKAKEAELAEASTDRINTILTSSDPLAAIEQEFLSAIPEEINEMVSKSENQKALHSELLRSIPGIANRMHAVLSKKRQSFINESVLDGIGASISNPALSRHTTNEDNLTITDNQKPVLDTDPVTRPKVLSDAPRVVRNKVTVYSPQKEYDKMEGGYPSSIAGPDGKRLVRTLEDFRSGRSDYVTIAGDPQFYNNRYVIPSLRYRNKQGHYYDLENVPVVVHDTGPAFKGKPEGRFDIPPDKDLGEQARRENDALMVGVTFVEDEASRTESKKPVKRTAAEVTKSRVEDVAFQQERSALDFFNQITSSVNSALNSPGVNLDEAVIRDRAFKEAEGFLNNMILRGNHVQVQEMLDLASTNKVSLAGQPYPSDMLARLHSNVLTQERRLDENPEVELSQADRDLKKKGLQQLNQLATQAAMMSPEEVTDQARLITTDIEKEAFNSDASNTLIAEFRKEAQLIQQTLRERAGQDWNGIYKEPSFGEDLGKKLDPNQRFAGLLTTAMEVKRIAKLNDVDLSEVLDTPGDYSSWGSGKKEVWDDLTNGFTTTSITHAINEATADMVKKYQDAGEDNPKRIIMLQDEDDDGNPIIGEDGQPKMIASNLLFQKLLRRYNTEKLTEIITNTSEQNRLIENAQILKGRQKQAVEDPFERSAEAKKLEEEFGRDDFLDADGKSTRQYGNMDSYFAGNDGDFLDRWVKTAENPEALALMEAQTDKRKLELDLENVTSRITPKYLQSAVREISMTNNAVSKLSMRTRLETQLKYTGLPMTMHREAKGMLINFKGEKPKESATGEYITGKSIPATTIDLNRQDRYSNPETAKTHVYSFYATREAGFEDTKNVRLRELYNIYFKGQEATYPVETFISDQTELGKQLKIISSK